MARRLEPSSVEGAEYTGNVLHLTERAQTAVFKGIGSRPVMSLNRSFSAPINLHFDQSPADLALLATHETDHFARWQALTDLALPTCSAPAATPAGKPSCCQTFIDALLAAAADESLEPAFRAQALALPSEADIARELGSNNDPDAIHAGRQAVMQQVAKPGKAVFAALYDSMTTPGAFSPDAASAGRRALAQHCAHLSVLCREHAGTGKGCLRRRQQHDRPDAGADDPGASFPDSDERPQGAGHVQGPLSPTMRWSSTSGSPSRRPFRVRQTLDRVVKLMDNPLFKRTNPNRVRALVGTFAFRQPDRLQPRRWRRLPFLARADPRHRRSQPAAGCPHPHIDALLALAGAGRAEHARKALAEIAAAPKACRRMFAISSSARSRDDL
jgi:aminopeptidase N